MLEFKFCVISVNILLCGKIMEAAWRFRIMLIMAFAVIIFGDFLGYGNARIEKVGRRNPSALRENPPHLDFDPDDDDDDSVDDVEGENEILFS